MIRVRRPTPEEIAARLAARQEPPTYPDVGATRDAAVLAALAERYIVDRHRFVLGVGRELFERARVALLAWRQFDIAWLELHGAAAEPSPGQVVATLARVAGVWFLNPCVVVYADGIAETSDEVAFAYGTLPGHVEEGEERFVVRLDPSTEQVTFEIVAFSRPAILLARIAKPWVRRIQRRFASSAAEALARACRLSVD